MDIEIVPAQAEDAVNLVKIYNLSFYSDYIKYGKCPGYNRTADSMVKTIQNNFVYKILFDDKLIGAISIKPLSDTDFFLGALCVIPKYANKGIGTQAMRFLDSEFASATHWALETPSDKSENHRFYKKFGYKITKEYTVDNIEISYFERWL